MVVVQSLKVKVHTGWFFVLAFVWVVVVMCDANLSGPFSEAKGVSVVGGWSGRSVGGDRRVGVDGVMCGADRCGPFPRVAGVASSSFFYD